jgi:hypothetical protein
MDLGESMFHGGLVTTIALIIFYCGASFNRIKSLEHRMKEREEAEEDINTKLNQLGALVERVDGVRERLEGINRSQHDLRNIMIRFLAKIPQESGDS